MPDQDARSELRVLQAVRLAGVADENAILDRALVAEEEVDRVLVQAQAAEQVERFSFANTSGWVITEVGSVRLAALLSDEVASRAATPVVEATLRSFEPLNGRFVALVSGWQLRSTSSAESGFGPADAGEVDDLLSSLSSIGSDLRGVLSDLIGVLPRFGRYPAQYAAAVERSREEGLRWVTGVGLLSCHVVWAELHQDLFSTLGRNRHDDGPGR